MKTHICSINIILAMSAVFLAGCASKPPTRTEPAQATKTTGSELDSAQSAALRTGETLRAYPINRYVDPRNPDVMHEAHALYRKETPAAWNLGPSPTTASAVMADQKLAAQNRLVAALVEQNRTLIAELSRLTGEIALMREHNKNRTKQP